MQIAQVGETLCLEGMTRDPAQEPATPGLALKLKTCTAELFLSASDLDSYTMTDKGIMLGRNKPVFSQEK